MSSPLISIILPVYNGELYLNDAIRSCLKQTYSNIELIIINDGSTDASLKIARNWESKDSRVTVFSNEKNSKIPASLNLGHYKAKGDFITWTSHDNRYSKWAIECLYRNLIKYNSDIIYSEYLHINSVGALIGQSHLKDIEHLYFYGVIGACFLYKMEVFERNKGYDENLFMVEDYDFWLRALKHSRFKKIDNPGIYKYRYHSESLTDLRLKNLDSKREFYAKLNLTYTKLFSSASESEILVKYFLGINQNAKEARVLPLKKSFFKNLRPFIGCQTGIEFIKLKRIILNDLVEYIMHKKNSQNLKTLYQLHKIGFRELLRLPTERYMALIKKCLF